MAMFPCITGIPTKLNSDMQAVLNKKMGTSGQTYPSQTWADEVNLMGKLPEKIVSGSIAHIEDGADTVPLKAWDVTVDANLDGVSSVKATQAGKNLADFSTFVDGYVNTNGTFNTNHSNGEMRSGFIPVKPSTTYYFSIIETTGTAADWVGIGEYTSNDVTTFIRRDSFWRFTTSANAKYIVISSRNLAQATKIQLEVGNDPTTWKAYTPIEQYTVPLGRTIYGGSADAVTGEGQATYKGYNLANLTWSGSYFDGNWVWYADLSSDGLKLPFASVVFSGICDTYTPIHYSGVSSNTNTIALRNNGSLYVNNGSSETEPTGKVTIELATPTDFTFDPITPPPETALGVNNFWADEGDSEVTYRADIDLALSALGGRGLSMMRPINTEEIEYEEGEYNETIR